MYRHFGSRPLRTRQRGAALFFATIFLIVMTLLALAAANTSLLQERMVGGLRNDQLALLGAESALREAERELWQLNYVGRQPLPPCPVEGSLCVWSRNTEDERRVPETFRGTTEQELATVQVAGEQLSLEQFTGLSGSLLSSKLAEEPRYLIEHLSGRTTQSPKEFRVQGVIYPEGQNLGSRTFYRITARSTGGNPASQRAVEAVYSTVNLSATGFNPDEP